MRGETILDTRTACGQFVLPASDKVPDLALRTVRQQEAWGGKMTPPVYAALHGISLATARSILYEGHSLPKRAEKPDNPVGSAMSPEPYRRGRPRAQPSEAEVTGARVILAVVGESFGVTTKQMLSLSKHNENVNAARTAAFAICYQRIKRGAELRLSYSALGKILNGRSDQAIYNALRTHNSRMSNDDYRARIQAVHAEISRRMG